MANINSDKVLNSSSEREQHQNCLDVAEREKNQGTKVLNRPPLRFPEFMDDWKRMKASDLLDFYSTNSLAWEALNYESGAILNLHYGLIHKGMSTLIDTAREKLPYINGENTPRKYTLCKCGDVAFADASEDTEEVGKAVEFASLGDDKVVCGLHTIHGRDKTGRTVTGFKGYAFNSKPFHNQMRRIAQGTKIYSINTKNFEEVYVGIPSKEEQAKITKLLALIDERISTQIGLIEDLKKLKSAIRKIVFKHIKGSVVALQDIANIYQPQTISSTDLTTDGYLVYGANGVIGHYSQYNHEKEQICITCRGNTCGTVNYTKPKSWITGNSMVINTDDYSDIVNRRFLYQYLSNINFQSIISGSGQPQIVRSPLAKLKIVLPSIDEQTKIAERLSAIEKKIAVETAVKGCYVRQRQYLLSQMFV